MKAQRVVVIALLFLGSLIIAASYSLTLTAIIKKDTAIFPVNEDGPLSERAVIEYALIGDEVRIIGCVDAKTDRYLVVRTSSGAVGRLYRLDNKISASASFGKEPRRLRPGELIGCLLWLAN